MDESTEVRKSLIPNLDQTIENYANAFSIQNFDPSDYQRVELPIQSNIMLNQKGYKKADGQQQALNKQKIKRA